MDYSFIDKDGAAITVGNKTTDDDVLFDGEHYYRIYEHVHVNNNPSNVEMISCNNGYKHAISQSDITNFVRVGKYADNVALLESD